jgi:hypothetical protein
MAPPEKQAERDRRRRAYRELKRSLAGIGIYAPTASTIFEVLSKARLSESYAASSELSREELFGHVPNADIPDELSDKSISGHLANAARLYSTAAAKCVLIPAPGRAFKYFRRSARLFRRAADLQNPPDYELIKASQASKSKADMARTELARRTLCRRKWSLGLLPRAQ